jgi:hypothetical protein
MTDSEQDKTRQRTEDCGNDIVEAIRKRGGKPRIERPDSGGTEKPSKPAQ